LRQHSVWKNNPPQPQRKGGLHPTNKIKNMKLNKTLMVAALVAGGLFAPAVLQAQDAPKDTPPAATPPGANARARLNPEQIAKDLGLSDEQKAKFKEASADMQKKMQELRKDTTLSQEDRRAKMKEIRDGLNAKVKEILTAEQFEKFQKLMPGPRNRPAAGGDNAAPKKD
jgi:periplasmic protein CpxP/Spy